MAKPFENKAFFSVVTVTKDHLEGLKTTEKSLQNQIFKNFEWIVIDGASTDGTPAYLQTTKALWTSEPDNGLYEAMNKGLEKAKGQYLLFLNAGDTLATPETLSWIQACAVNTSAFIYADALENGHYKTARSPNIKTGMFTHHQAMLYRKDIIRTIRYNTAYTIAADYDFTARILKQTRDILYCPFPVCDFEAGGLSQTGAVRGRKEQFEIRKNLKLTGPFQNTAITMAQTALWQLRRIAPALYWHMKSSGNTPGAKAQTKTPAAHPANPA